MFLASFCNFIIIDSGLCKPFFDKKIITSANFNRDHCRCSPNIPHLQSGAILFEFVSWNLFLRRVELSPDFQELWESCISSSISQSKSTKHVCAGQWFGPYQTGTIGSYSIMFIENEKIMISTFKHYPIKIKARASVLI